MGSTWLEGSLIGGYGVDLRVCRAKINMVWKGAPF